jgi:hypothetical protein
MRVLCGRKGGGSLLHVPLQRALQLTRLVHAIVVIGFERFSGMSGLAGAGDSRVTIFRRESGRDWDGKVQLVEDREEGLCIGSLLLGILSLLERAKCRQGE